MNISKINFGTPKDYIQYIVEFSYQYRKDFIYLNKITNYNLSEWLDFATKKYIIHDKKTEVLMRPFFFYEYGSDCDNQVSFILSYLFNEKRTNLDTVYLQLSELKNSMHIQIGFYSATRKKIMIADMLPGPDWLLWQMSEKKIIQYKLTEFIDISKL